MRPPPQIDKIRVETFRLGKSICLFRPDNQALCLLNDMAGELWQAWREGASADDLVCRITGSHDADPVRAKADVEDLIDNWYDCGLADPACLMRSEEPSRLAPATFNQNLAQEPVLDACYGVCAAPAIHIRCHEPVLAGLLEAVLAPMGLDEPAEEREIVIAQDETGYWIADDGKITLRGLERAQARRLVLRAVLLHRQRHRSVGAILHGSAVVANGRAIILAGASGAGKTTLAARLIHAGMCYLGDDLLPLHLDGRTVGDFPAALAIKAGSWPVVAQSYPELEQLKTLTTRRLNVRYLALASAPAAPRDQEIGALLFPQYDVRQPFSVSPLMPEDAFARLIDTGSTPEGTPLSLKPMVRLANSTPAWQIRFSNSDDVVRWCVDNFGTGECSFNGVAS